VLLPGTACAYGLPLLTASRVSTGSAGGPAGKRKWGMVIDLTKCKSGCTACVDACRRENNVALHGNKKWDVHLIRKVTVKREFPVGGPEKPVLLLCNHCDHPPCAQACPVQATYKRDDGIVIVDPHRCIGCRYCMIACPYNARHYNYKENPEWPTLSRPRSSHGVPQSCDLCAHLLDKDQMPACVAKCREVCGKDNAALFVGDLNDPDSDVSRKIANNPVKVLREDLGTKPKVYYIGL